MNSARRNPSPPAHAIKSFSIPVNFSTASLALGILLVGMPPKLELPDRGLATVGEIVLDSAMNDFQGKPMTTTEHAESFMTDRSAGLAAGCSSGMAPWRCGHFSVSARHFALRP
jgi:hypothetical protein